MINGLSFRGVWDGILTDKELFVSTASGLGQKQGTPQNEILLFSQKEMHLDSNFFRNGCHNERKERVIKVKAREEGEATVPKGKK